MGKLNDGKDFESIVQGMLQERVKERPSYFLRLYDTHSAGSFLPAQPCDFLLFENGRAVFMEAKSSVKHHSLKSCLSSTVKNTQVAKMRLALRTGQTGCFLFYDMQDKQVEIWHGQGVIGCRVEGKRLNDSILYIRVPTASFHEAFHKYLLDNIY